MKVKRGDIYWITKNPHRPTSGSVQQPGRPGIIVSNDAKNACALTFEIVYLTGKPKKALPTHCTINSAPRSSIALCEQIQTVSDEQLQEYIAHCTEEEMAEIDRCITISLGLPDPLEDLREGLREAAVLKPCDEIIDPFAVIHDLELKLAEASARACLLQQMYDNLLERTIT